MSEQPNCPGTVLIQGRVYPCHNHYLRESGWCYAHDPALKEVRRERASRAVTTRRENTKLREKRALEKRAKPFRIRTIPQVLDGSYENAQTEANALLAEGYHYFGHFLRLYWFAKEELP